MIIESRQSLAKDYENPLIKKALGTAAAQHHYIGAVCISDEEFAVALLRAQAEGIEHSHRGDAFIAAAQELEARNGS